MAIKKCVCKNKGQDKLHGVGMRVMNKTHKDKAGTSHRCTVCGVEKTT